MEDDAKLERLINQCKSNDVDVRIDAVTKLQAEFEAGIEITEAEPLINVLKASLRTANQHLATATLSALPPLLPLLLSRVSNYSHAHPIPSASSSTSSTASTSLVDTMTLRQVINAFLPAGGVLERLGDSREKAREKARETLVILGGLAFRSGASSSLPGKSRDSRVETPLAIFERFLREGGLASKVWRVREQSILTLVHIRRVHHLFPMRPYLPLLVDTLEDTDAHVRECSRQSIVELFTGPGVIDAARADLKKEMTKKGVRKTIVDSVLAKLMTGGRGETFPQSDGSENGDASRADKPVYIPPSMALQGRKTSVTAGSTTGMTRTFSQTSVKDSSRPASRAAGPSPAASAESAGADVQPVYIASSRDLEQEFALMIKPFEGKETEHNWSGREHAVQRVRGMLKGDVHIRYTDTFLNCLKEGFVKDSLKALASLRTTVSANTCSLYAELAIALNSGLDPWCEALLSHLLRMAGFTKKIVAQQSQATVSTILSHVSAQPRLIIPLFWNTLQEKTVQARAYAVGHIKLYLELHGVRAKHSIESSGGLDILENITKKSLADANPAVRESARVCFWVFEEIWPERGVVILESMDTTARKQLEKVCPDPDRAKTVLPPVTPKMKKSSVAAAIAASRAKAKAIATAPPTLRHQATSTSHAVRATSPPLRSPTSPQMLTSRSSLRASSPSPRSPPTPPRSRIISNSMPRPASTSAVPVSHSRSSSSSSPPSSPQADFRRRTSSPLAPVSLSPGRNSLIRATQTALPASPPNSTSYFLHSPTPRPTGRAVGPVPVPVRQSLALPVQHGDEDSLLLATAIPIPEDSDSDMDGSTNLMSFSTPFEVYPPKPRTPGPRSTSQARSFSPRSSESDFALVSNALSTNSLPTGPPQPIVEDAMRARAEQAESTAERLLELVDPEDEATHHSTIPASLLISSGAPKLKAKVKPAPVPSVYTGIAPPVTPINRNTAIMKQIALFKNSPARNGTSGSLMDMLTDRKHETGWWLKRMTMIDQGTPLKGVEPPERVDELQNYIVALEDGDASIRVLQKLAHLCIENPVAEPSSPSTDFSTLHSPSPLIGSLRSLPSLHDDMWMKDKSFERVFNALIKFLTPEQNGTELEYGLIVLWEMLDNQAPYIEGREADIFSALLTVRYCNKLNVLEATNTIRDALTSRIEPVYGLTTMHASLRAFYADASPALATADIKAATYAYGLIALGKFILRLPGEILEEELPRLKNTLIAALTDSSSLVVREAAAASIIAAQLVLRDETHLFTLLDGLADEKKNLLTYLFEKHGVRGVEKGAGIGSGMEKLEKEMRRLDTRTSTPRKPDASAP